MISSPAREQKQWPRNEYLATLVFVSVFGFQFLLVAHAGTDIPFWDQWDVEGRLLYPHWLGGSLTIDEMFKAHNEHRILWTKVLDVILFTVNGCWDPLVQILTGIPLRAACATFLYWGLTKEKRFGSSWFVVFAASVAYLPHLAWHNVLWGFQSSVWFAIGFGLFSLAFAKEAGKPIGFCLALGSGLASQLGMGGGLMLPVAFFGVVFFRAILRRRLIGEDLPCALIGGMLLLSALLLRTRVDAHIPFHPSAIGEGLLMLSRVLAWPHFDMPIAAIVVNLPLAVFTGLRFWKRCPPTPGEEFAVAVGIWALAIAAAAVWSRGAAPEFSAALPSRYIDFIVLLSVTNMWCGWSLVYNLPESYKKRILLGFSVWVLFILVGWLGLSSELMKGLILPRIRDRDAPIRFAVEYQRTWDPRVFDGQPRLYIPHPSLEVVHSVLTDAQLKGHLPPSFQPNEPLGTLSRGARWMISHTGVSMWLLCSVPFMFIYLKIRYCDYVLSTNSANERR